MTPSAWLAVATHKPRVCELLRIAWRTVGAIHTRVAVEAVAARGRVRCLTSTPSTTGSADVRTSVIGDM